VAVTVADTGPGIPRHALKKVFDDFYRVEDALTRTTGGTGIGLSLVKKFMQAMGGSVTRRQQQVALWPTWERCTMLPCRPAMSNSCPVVTDLQPFTPYPFTLLWDQFI
jgi:hypothetical protein